MMKTTMKSKTDNRAGANRSQDGAHVTLQIFG